MIVKKKLATKINQVETWKLTFSKVIKSVASELKSECRDELPFDNGAYNVCCKR